MMNGRVLQRFLERALPQLSSLTRVEFTLGEARQIVLLVTQLRAVLGSVERRSASLDPQAR